MPVFVPIPSWNAEGLLPPIDVLNPTSANRAPYPVSLSDLVLRFGTSPERRAILSGFLDYREALHAIGLTVGFQWVDGSFVEHIEIGDRNRPPHDVDVVTFFQLPAGTTQRDLAALAPELFPANEPDRNALKTRFSVDGFWVHLGTSGERLLESGTYWYGVWAHQRDSFRWKGFLQIDLYPGEDSDARKVLNSLSQGGTS